MGNSGGTPTTVEVFFIVDGPRLQAQACLLAPMLHRHLGPGQRAVAYVRGDCADAIDPLTREVLARAGTLTRIIPGTAEGDGPGPWTAPYPQGNKILAAAAPRDCDVSVFLDTDTVLTRPVDFAAALGSAGIAAAVSDYASPGTDPESWRAHYGLFGLPLPDDRVTLRSGRRLETLPYFNAGVVIFRERGPDGRPSGIGADWLDTAARLDRAGAEGRTAPFGRTYADQIALPIVAARRGGAVHPLPRRLNFNIEADGGAPQAAAAIAHYHRAGVLWAHEGHARATLAALAELMGADAPERLLAAFHPHLKRQRLKRHLAAMRSGDRAEEAA